MTTRSTYAQRVAAGRGSFPRQTWISYLRTLFDVRRSRLQLSELTDDQLRDIGLNRDDVESEIARPIWDVPPHWRR